jgi:prepilin-type N-terminal cleavage/methylation domain-containing protein
MNTLFSRIRNLRNQARQSEDGFSLIEMIVVMILIGVIGTTVANILISTNQTAAEFNNPPSCQNLGETAELLCLIQDKASEVKGDNELIVLDRDMVLPELTNVPSTLVWQVGTVKNGPVCVVGYDLTDSTSIYTHDKPFVYDPTFGVNSSGIGCGKRNSDGTYSWANDPTIPKPVRVLQDNAPEPVKVVGPAGSINGTIDSMRTDQTIHVVIKKAYESTSAGTTHGEIMMDATYKCSNGYMNTQRLVAAVITADPKATWQGHLYTYGGVDGSGGPCNPTSVSLAVVSGEPWTLNNTETFSYPGAV